MNKIQIVACLVLFWVSLAQAEKASSSFTENLDISGRLMLDYEQFDGLHNAGVENDEISIRRASVRVKYEQNDLWTAKIRIGYNEDDERVELEEYEFVAHLANNIDITAGFFKEPSSLEYITSSKDLLVKERTMMTEAFAGRRNKGLQISRIVSQDTGGHHWALGIFDNAQQDEFSKMAITGRYAVHFTNDAKTWPAFMPKSSVLHLGVSGSYRKEDPEDAIRINERIEVFKGDAILESNRIDADSRKILGVELGFSSGSFNIISEFMQEQVSANSDSNDIDSEYSGGYVQAGYILSGQTLRYDDLRFEGVRPRSSKNVWMLVARYSELDARDNNRGGEAENISLGVNYYLNRNYKFMLSVSRAKLSGRNAIFSDEGDAISFRAQYRF